MSSLCVSVLSFRAGQTTVVMVTFQCESRTKVGIFLFVHGGKLLLSRLVQAQGLRSAERLLIGRTFRKETQNYRGSSRDF
jgi:hypothetical protein